MQIQYDYQNFNPESGGAQSFPPSGEYTLQLISAKDDLTRSGDRKATLEFKVHGGDYHNQTFTIGYNIGNSNAQARQIAFEGLGKIWFGITGQVPPATGFDVAKLFNGFFHAELKVVVGEKYTNADLRNIKSVDNSAVPQVAQAVIAGSAPQVTGKPSWAN